MAAGPGRFSKLTPEVQRTIVDAVSAGVPMKYAAMRAGVTDRTTLRWARRGRRLPDSVYGSFLSAVKKAEADAVARNVAIIQKAAAEHWQAAAWYLERRTDEFVRRERTELSGPKGRPIPVAFIEFAEATRDDDGDAADGGAGDPAGG